MSCFYKNHLWIRKASSFNTTIEAAKGDGEEKKKGKKKNNSCILLEGILYTVEDIKGGVVLYLVALLLHYWE